MMPHIGRIGEDEIEALRGRTLLGEIPVHDVKAALAPEIPGCFRKQGIKLDAGGSFYVLCRHYLGQRRVERSGSNRRVQKAQPRPPLRFVRVAREAQGKLKRRSELAP